MTKKEYSIKMIEECLGVQVQDYDGSEKSVRMECSRKESSGCWPGVIRVDVRKDRCNNIVLLDLGASRSFDQGDAQKLKEYMEDHGTSVSIVESTGGWFIEFQCEDYPWHNYVEPEAKEIFKPGTKVRFTQEAKDRWDDEEYWHSACSSYIRNRLDETWTIKSFDTEGYLSYHLEEDPCQYYIADYLLEEVPEEKEQPKAKPEILEIAKLREENRDLKEQIKELEAECRAWAERYSQEDGKPEPEEVHQMHVFTLPFLGFGFGW